MIIIKEQGHEKTRLITYKCPQCNIKNSIYRAKVDDYKCRTCGCIWGET